MQDTTTIKLILEASPDIGMNYGIIVNMLSKGTVLQSEISKNVRTRGKTSARR